MLHPLGEILQRVNLLEPNRVCAIHFLKPRTFIERDSNIRIDIKLLAVDFVFHSLSDSGKQVVRLIYEV